MLRVQVGGSWLSTVGPYGPVTVEYGEHGPEAASWQMEAERRHPVLRGNAPVVIHDGALPIWRGTLNEPGTEGQLFAKGLWHQARTIPALDAGLNYTTVPNTAVDAAIARGEVSWTRPASLGATATAPNSNDLTLEAILNWTAAELGMRWFMNGLGQVAMVADPTTPKWIVPHAAAGRGLTPAEDEFATHLVGRYLNAATGTYLSATVGSADAATTFGRRTVKVDLTPLGGIDATRATDVLTGMFLRSGARMGWSEGLNLGWGQITTPGGTPAPLAQIQSLQMVRIGGVVDTSRASLLRGYQDIVLGGVRYAEGERTISMSPIGMADRSLGEVLTVAVEQ